MAAAPRANADAPVSSAPAGKPSTATVAAAITRLASTTRARRNTTPRSATSANTATVPLNMAAAPQGRGARPDLANAAATSSTAPGTARLASLPGRIRLHPLAGPPRRPGTVIVPHSRPPAGGLRDQKTGRPGRIGLGARASGGHLMELGNYALSILISLGIGLAGFVLAYKIFDWLTPKLQFEEQLIAGNRAVAIFLAGLFIGLGLLLGNAVK